LYKYSVLRYMILTIYGSGTLIDMLLSEVDVLKAIVNLNLNLKIYNYYNIQ